VAPKEGLWLISPKRRGWELLHSEAPSASSLSSGAGAGVRKARAFEFERSSQTGPIRAPWGPGSLGSARWEVALPCRLHVAHHSSSPSRLAGPRFSVSVLCESVCLKFKRENSLLSRLPVKPI